MTFSEAMTAVAEGKKIARPCWVLREESPFVHLVYEHATLTSGEWHSPYNPWLGDLIATDWEVIQEPETGRTMPIADVPASSEPLVAPI